MSATISVLMQLSKSDYMLFLKHPAWLWLKKHDYKKLPAIDENAQAVFEAGNVFESYAELQFPEGFRLGFEGYDEYSQLTEATKQMLDEGMQTIFQGRFETEKLTCITDVLDHVEGNTYDLYEIKASSRAKTEHYHDLAFQTAVLEAAGYTIRNIAVIHVDGTYIRDGEPNYHKLTKTVDITAKVRSLQKITEDKIAEALAVIALSEIPDISPRYAAMGGMGEWMSIYRTLRPDLPRDSIYDLCSISAKTIGQFEDMGILHIKDIPIGHKLTAKQQLQAEAVRQGKILIEPSKITKFLDSFTYPLYFLDYETLASIVPYFDRLQPYKQLPFQYSLHILEAPGAELRHVTYLQRDDTNPAEPLTKSLQSHIGTSGSVITWNMSFEKGCNTLVGKMLPEYKEFYEQLNERVVDLMLPFYQGWYVHKDFCGSASIKKVLPVVVPELSYKTLGIQEGAGAQRLWMEAVLDGKRASEKEQILSDLDKYCALDTLAMVKIHEYLRTL